MERENSGPPHIVLAGAGAVHLELLRLLSRRKLPETRIAMISESRYTINPLAVPVVAAGLYRSSVVTSDLQRLCEGAGVEFVESEIAGVDTGNHVLLLRAADRFPFRILSFDAGTRAAFSDDPSVKSNAVTMKPARGFLSAIDTFAEEFRQGEIRSIVIVGGGKAGVELVFALKQRLGADVLIHLVHAHSRVLDEHTFRTANCATALLEDQKIVLHLGECVTEVTTHSVICESGLEVPADIIIWAAHPEPALKWLKRSGLAADNEGFLKVRETLQSESHAFVFAAGDCAVVGDTRMHQTARSVTRQAALLYRNLRKWLAGDPLDNLQPGPIVSDLIFAGADGAIVETKAFSFSSKLAGMVLRRAVGRADPFRQTEEQ